MSPDDAHDLVLFLEDVRDVCQKWGLEFRSSYSLTYVTTDDERWLCPVSLPLLEVME